MKLHLGCGSKILDGYVNIDAYVDDPLVSNFDILNLPYKDNSVDRVLAEHVVEHLPLVDEQPFFLEARRVLKEGADLVIEVPDMEWLCQRFLEGADNFTTFYKVGEPAHYFGNGIDEWQRWGIITTHFWGNQNGAGQFHRNGYTLPKLERIGQLIGFRDTKVHKAHNKGAQVLIAEFTK